MHVHFGPRWLPTVGLLLTLSVVARGGAEPPQNIDYRIGPMDVVTVSVWNQQTLSGRFTVDNEGAFTYPLLGRVRVAGLTPQAAEHELRSRLADGFVNDPQVTLSVEQYRSQQIVVIGEVRQPGTYPLTGSMTLVEALARAGSTTERAGSEVLVIRRRSGTASSPAVAQRDSTLIRADLDVLQRGDVAQNVALSDGDAVVVSRADIVYVFGQVRSPGAYPVRKGTRIVQVLSLAGGLTERGSISRVRIERVVNGVKTEIKAGMDDVVRPDDTVIVRERFL